MQTLSLLIPPALARKTVKAVLRQEFKMANGLIARIKLRETGILLNGNRVHTNHIVKTGDLLTVEIGDLTNSTPITPIAIPLEILWEDENLLVINKPAGLAVHGATGPEKNPTLANALAHYWGPKQIFHPVNRLDRGTSGVMTIAKNSYMHDRMRTLLHTQAFHREYLGIAMGQVIPASRRIDLAIGRTEGSIIQRQITPGGKPAQTFYKTLQNTPHYTLLELHPQTGRTHQLRLHLSAIGFPLVGDWLYGTENKDLITRPALHSYQLSFIHPLTREKIRIQSPLPDDMVQLLKNDS